MKKEILVLLVIFAFLLNLQLVLSLGISPGIESVDFKPGLELEYSFSVYAEPEQIIEIYSEGEFSDLVRFDKTELKGGGGFNVKLKLPQEIEIPGKHVLLIGARDKVDPEVGMIGTSVIVRAPIIIHVPYPGKYAEISFSTQNANVGDSVKFEVTVASMGKEPIFAITNIDIYSEKKKIETLDLGAKIIENQKSDKFIKILNTSNYNPGDYNATAIVDYQVAIARTSSVLRIGQLFVNMTNYTNEIIKGGIKPFEIHVESLWNDPIEDVYGEVSVLKNNLSITNFLTPSVSLLGWEKKTLNGYVDTNVLEMGEYDLDINISYGGKKTLNKGKLTIEREQNYLIYYIIGGVLIVLIILIVLYFKFRKSIFNKNGKSKKRKIQ
ncbi:MAG: hypothetical protein Q8N63_07850 [Nanoarchaeota archaeon]|nr:hypothetical protein [Nanoarchaeota archaeon]